MIMEILLMMVLCVVALHFLIYIFISIYWEGGGIFSIFEYWGDVPINTYYDYCRYQVYQLQYSQEFSIYCI